MISRLSQVPMLRMLVPFAVGILIAIFFPVKASIAVVLSCITFSFMLAWSWYFNRNQDYKYRLVFGALSAIFIALSGFSITLLRQPETRNSYYGHFIEAGTDSLLVTIVSQPVEKEKTIKTTAEVTAIVKNGKAINTSGKALLYFEKDSLAETIRYGDCLYLHAFIHEVKGPSNPDEFNYRRYLKWHGTSYEGYMRGGTWTLVKNNNVTFLLDFAARSRMKLVKLLRDQVKGSEASLASAILLGYREDLPQPLIQQFADSGVIHVICVAGLHVGILFGIIAWLLLPIEKIRGGKLIRLILILLLLWLYAFLTGLATPVLRATVMFSFILVGRFFARYSNSMNNLAAAAVLLLLFNPFSIADTGFQLSFLSVAGIIILYPVFYELAEFRNYLPDKLWELACLSLSAQLAIAPLSIIYFHQFPNYFVFTNLLIVPMLFLAVVFGVLFLSTAFIPFLSAACAFLLREILALMNGTVGQMHRLPFFATKGISISIPELIILYTIIIALIWFLMMKNKPALIIALTCIITLTGIRVWKSYRSRNQEVFAVYDIRGHSAVAFISGKQCALVEPVDSLNFCEHIQEHWWARGVNDSTTIRGGMSGALLTNHLCFQSPTARFNRLQIAFIRRKEDIPASKGKIKVNYLVISGGYKQDMAALQNAFIFDRLIFDSSVSIYRIRKWEEECEQLHINYYDVGKRGAFVEEVGG